MHTRETAAVASVMPAIAHMPDTKSATIHSGYRVGARTISLSQVYVRHHIQELRCQLRG